MPDSRRSSPQKYQLGPDSPALGSASQRGPAAAIPPIRAAATMLNHPNSPEADSLDHLHRPTSAASMKHFSIAEQDQAIPTLREDRDAPNSRPHVQATQMFKAPLAGAGALGHSGDTVEPDGAGVLSAPRVSSAPPQRAVDDPHVRARKHWQQAVHEIALRGLDDGTGQRASTERRKQANRSRWNALLTLADPRAWHFYAGPKIARAEQGLEKKLDKVHKSSATDDARKAELRCMLIKLKQKKRPDAKDLEMISKIQHELKVLEDAVMTRARSPSLANTTIEMGPYLKPSLASTFAPPGSQSRAESRAGSVF